MDVPPKWYYHFLVTHLLQRFPFRLGVGLVIASLVPLLFIGGVALYLANDALEEVMVKKHQAVLDAVGGSVDMFLSQQISRLERLAAHPKIQGLDHAKAEAVLQEFLTDNHLVSGITLFDSGQNLVSFFSRQGSKKSLRPLGENLRNLSDPGLRPLKVSFGELILNKTMSVLSDEKEGGGSRDLLFVLPVFDFADPDLVRGIMAAEAVLNGTDIQDMLNSLPLHGLDYVCFLSGSAEILARRGAGLSPRARSLYLAPEVLRDAREEGKILTLTLGNEGREDLLSLTFSPKLSGFIAIGQPREEAFRLIVQLRENFLVIIALALVFSLAVGFWLVTTISRPIGELTEGIQKVHDGAYSHRVPAGSDDDLGRAGSALNRLAEALQKKMLIGSIWTKIRAPKPPRDDPGN